MLRALVSALPDFECYCIPYSHLVEFYGSEGFEVHDPVAALSFLGERIAAYRADGLDVLLMRRAARSALTGWRPR